ncbi:transposase, IS605 OrfB family [Vulcanisaeta moutnovskia 768-28]|uniref:Transposase, IS605 OrfB family n=1 Tax=Vulcanisaeta moutnovskia (strain 768-28) TaxID=985053 RepID=F0QUC4_VULM7|nr:transposase, IS605 OrfB family [Vulcanisaeta moutnovskia 768-28]
MCAHRLLNDVKGNDALLGFSQASFLKYARERCYELLPNRRYIDGVATLVHSTLRSARKLGVNIRDIELGQWLLFQSEAESEKRGNLNIRLLSVNKAEVLVLNYDGASKRIDIGLKTPKGYVELLKVLIERAGKYEVGYPARVMVRGYNFRPGNMHLYCGLQVMVPYSLYLDVMRRYSEPRGNLIGGVDVNVNRLNLAIVDRYGRLRDVKTFWFREVTARGFKGVVAWTKIHQAIHELLNYAYHHGVSAISLENPRTIGYLRYYWVRNGDRGSRNYNYRVSIFRSRTIEVISYKAPLYAMRTIYVNPKGTTNSQQHDEVMRKYGLDRHTASAYLIALRGINKQRK